MTITASVSIIQDGTYHSNTIQFTVPDNAKTEDVYSTLLGKFAPLIGRTSKGFAQEITAD
jgi:hypothetical protein